MSRQRRDPRIERTAHRVDGTSRPRFDIASVTGGKRPRRNPREEERLATVAGSVRHRLDRSQRSPVFVVAAERPVPIAEAAPRLVIINEPAFLVAVVPDAPGGRLTPHDRQLLGAARLLADAGGAVLACVAQPIEELGAAGTDRIVLMPAADSTYDPENKAKFLAATIAALPVRHVLFAETPDGGDLARRVAAILDEPLFSGAESLTAKSVTRAAMGRRVEQRRAPPRLLTLAADAVAPHAGTLHEARSLPPPAYGADDATESAIISAEIIPADPATVPLTEADFVVSAGNGISDFETFRAVVTALNATPGASRVVCDAGLMPRSAQVGASGTVLEAACYFALGIAGAPQHLQGVAKCEHVVAVNTDLHAAMIERAGLAIVADAQKVMPAILALLREESL